MVRDGRDVQVVDAATGEDLTRLVMTQIIVESAKAPDSGFPLDMLRQMVIASGEASREGLRGYMKTMFDMYQNAYRTFTPGIGPFDFGERLSDAAPGTAPASETGTPPRSQTEQRSTEQLNERIAELERLYIEETSGG